MPRFVNEMIQLFRLELILQLSLATLFGGAIGLERELGGKPAGLRTNILICLGSVLYTKLSVALAAGTADPTRIAAQIVTGVGFIGAGTILHARGAVVGLTSAATIWVVAAIGVALGGAFYWEAAGTTLLVLVVLQGLGRVERFVGRQSTQGRLSVHARPDAAVLEELQELVRRTGLEIERQSSRRENVDLVIDFTLRGPKRLHDEALGPAWDVAQVRAPTVADGDGGSGSPEATTAAAGCEIYLGYGVPAGVIAAGRGTLRWVHTGTAGVAASLPRLAGTGIVLTNSAAVHAEPIADWVIAAIAYFARGLDRMHEFQAAARWAQADFTDFAVGVRELSELRLGVFGLGGIGAAVARRGVALGMRVAGVRRRPERGAPGGVRWVGRMADLARLVTESDCLVIAAPHTLVTQGAITRQVLEQLPRDAIIANVSRGSLLDERALLELLDAGRLRGAALDVFAVEPLPAGHPFWQHPRVLVSPHAAAVTARFWERETGLIVENIRRYLAGAPLVNVVDPEAGY
jgi:phosphoglycerate dehydrogenase-like enzyme/uncharacterized membrane protein YhiD involved in acid resistance